MSFTHDVTLWKAFWRRKSSFEAGQYVSKITTINFCCCFPTRSERWGHGGIPWNPRSRATGNPKAWTRDRKETESRQKSVAEQCRMRREVSWDECPQALQEGLSILPILERQGCVRCSVDKREHS